MFVLPVSPYAGEKGCTPVRSLQKTPKKFPARSCDV